MCDEDPIDIPPDGDPADILRPEERQRCECWSRVMGYMRPTSSWNIGKRGEWADRRFFTEATSARLMAPAAHESPTIHPSP